MLYQDKDGIKGLPADVFGCQNGQDAWSRALLLCHVSAPRPDVYMHLTAKVPLNFSGWLKVLIAISPQQLDLFGGVLDAAYALVRGK